MNRAAGCKKKTCEHFTPREFPLTRVAGAAAVKTAVGFWVDPLRGQDGGVAVVEHTQVVAVAGMGQIVAPIPMNLVVVVRLLLRVYHIVR